MIRLFTLFLLFPTCLIFAQDTTYYDSYHREVGNLKRADFYEIRFDEQDSLFKEVTYFPSGQMRSEGWFIQDSVKRAEGTWRAWHENGQLEEQGAYRHGRKVGNWKNWYANGQLKRDIDYLEGYYHGMRLTYWGNGRLKRRDSLLHGEVIRGLCLDSIGVPVEYFNFELLPGFPGGAEGFTNYLLTEVRYPQADINNNTQGRVVVQFTIDIDGHLRNPKVVEGLSPTLDKAVIKAIENSSRKWEPALIDGEPVRFYYKVPVNFRIRD